MRVVSDDVLKYKLFELIDSPKTAAKFATTAKRHHQLFQPFLDIPLFIKYVTYGQQDHAETILKAFKTLKDEKNLNLLLSTKMDVTDIAGKKFKKITAFQYTLWALDKHMWNMLLKYLPEDEAKIQLEELEKNGLNYTKDLFNPYGEDVKEESVVGEKHFNFNALIDALEVYTSMSAELNQMEATSLWCENVGGAQRNVPAHVMQEYTRTDRSFYPTPNFKENTLPRNLNVSILRQPYNSMTFWYDAGLGDKFAIYQHINPFTKSFELMAVPIASLDASSVDLAAVIALRDARSQEYVNLKTRLLVSEKYQENSR